MDARIAFDCDPVLGIVSAVRCTSTTLDRLHIRDPRTGDTLTWAALASKIEGSGEIKGHAEGEVLVVEDAGIVVAALQHAFANAWPEVAEIRVAPLDLAPNVFPRLLPPEPPKVAAPLPLPSQDDDVDDDDILIIWRVRRTRQETWGDRIGARGYLPLEWSSRPTWEELMEELGPGRWALESWIAGTDPTDGRPLEIREFVLAAGEPRHTTPNPDAPRREEKGGKLDELIMPLLGAAVQKLLSDPLEGIIRSRELLASLAPPTDGLGETLVGIREDLASLGDRLASSGGGSQEPVWLRPALDFGGKVMASLDRRQEPSQKSPSTFMQKGARGMVLGLGNGTPTPPPEEVSALLRVRYPEIHAWIASGEASLADIDLDPARAGDEQSRAWLAGIQAAIRALPVPRAIDAPHP